MVLGHNLKKKFLQESLEKTKKKKENELKKLQEDSDTFESKIKELKTYLYSKFGSNIYLESDS